jgi:UDPglucose 6-dehydrogenase
MKVAVIGTGYVGLTTGVCLSFVGHNVTCLDVDAEKVEALRGGRIPIFEPHLEELMRESVGRLHFTTGYEEAIGGAEVVFIAVGTPSAET